MSKSTTLFALGLLLFAFFAQAARPGIAAGGGGGVEANPQALVAAAAAAEGGCGDECMMRRTLEAHLDYIYTQEKKN